MTQHEEIRCALEFGRMTPGKALGDCSARC